VLSQKPERVADQTRVCETLEIDKGQVADECQCTFDYSTQLSDYGGMNNCSVNYLNRATVQGQMVCVSTAALNLIQQEEESQGHLALYRAR
jgi:hypothetical protein